MDTLQKAIENTLNDLPRKLIVDLVSKKLEAQGVKLSKHEFQRLRDHLLKGNREPITFKRKSGEHKNLNIDLNEETSKTIERLTTFFENDFPGVLEKLQSRFAKSIFIDLKRKWKAESSLQRSEIAGFRKRLERRWGIPLAKLQMLITLAREFGSNINQSLRAERDSNHLALIEVLTRSHARACQIAEEVICLLQSGFADGAMARWRTLHEIAVIALFVQQRGNKVAERYVGHQTIESFKAGAEYRDWQGRLNLAPISDETFSKLKISYDAALKKFGGAFRYAYGWAGDALGNPNPSFIDIEKASGIEHLRPYFRMASYNVHAGPKGAFFKLGLMPETAILLSGPSNAGLADPGHSTAISLIQVSSALGSLRSTFDNQVALRMMMLLQDEIGDAFLAAHQTLEKDEQTRSRFRAPQVE
jgi:hypothetical protein